MHLVGISNVGLQTKLERRYITRDTGTVIQNANMEIEDRMHKAQIPPRRCDKLRL